MTGDEYKNRFKVVNRLMRRVVVAVVDIGLILMAIFVLSMFLFQGYERIRDNGGETSLALSQQAKLFLMDKAVCVRIAQRNNF
ncbi:hypothetical protein [Saezia sanguinis]|uniref:hypothetical protein n=1 Tax=Saezia sanguinis TaxID=1965230 RepID=UPI00306F08DC